MTKKSRSLPLLKHRTGYGRCYGIGFCRKLTPNTVMKANIKIIRITKAYMPTDLRVRFMLPPRK
ncbi:TPA: hypothetical protein DCL89_00365 [candidate division WWE3 bacterium]|uniref:Uncharacterized protein n=1 Tax=candidate division WWE3 bacterium TaxID=2053526 RepID=A0A354G429_UNCKA|nr:MAG: hypothetical protein A2578_02010 [candidate division WWE3 bacterium RIFOXYD1_FULL_42_24]OGC74757.1 MAG: hypothetical protein A2425_01610 [candidate division WWE3 bacterium RIFOXYC1_FULL_42_17]HAI62668.1 hypothetical protein [candidate division WWE3 bacterium]HBI35767.1 hypothetical protein [candidate division WWE3 bacterium]